MNNNELQTSHKKLVTVGAGLVWAMFCCNIMVAVDPPRDRAMARDEVMASGKLEAAQERADAKIEASDLRAKATMEAADERAKAKIETAEERAQAKIETAEERAKARIETADQRATARLESTKERTDVTLESAQKRAEAVRDVSDSRAAATTASAQMRTRGVTGSNRMHDRFGVYASLWGDPYPTTVGANVAYNLTDYLRAVVGVGSDSVEDRFRVDTIGVGLKGFVPGWSLSPTLGINLANTVGSTGGTRTVRGFNPEGMRLYANVGLDWQTGIGVNLAAGWADSFIAGETGAFYINAGFFL